VTTLPDIDLTPRPVNKLHAAAETYRQLRVDRSTSRPAWGPDGSTIENLIEQADTLATEVLNAYGDLKLIKFILRISVLYGRRADREEEILRYRLVEEMVMSNRYPVEKPIRKESFFKLDPFYPGGQREVSKAEDADEIVIEMSCLAMQG
jgi:hypothetical protein